MNKKNSFIIIALIIVTFFNFTNIFAQKENKILIDALTTESIKIRGKISKSDNEFILDYFDPYENDSHAKFLQEKGYHGGGPSWLGIIYGALKLSDPNLLNELDVDTVTEGVSFFSKKKETLLKIGRLIAIIKNDNKLMNACIESGKKYKIMK